MAKRPVVAPWSRGINNGRAILTPALVRMIRASTASTRLLALELGVSKGCIDGVRYGEKLAAYTVATAVNRYAAADRFLAASGSTIDRSRSSHAVNKARASFVNLCKL